MTWLGLGKHIGLPLPLTLTLIFGCGPSTKIFISPDIEDYRLERIAVMPFTEDDRDRKGLKSQRVEKEGLGILTNIFYESLKENLNIQVISMEDVKKGVAGIVAGGGDLSPRSIAIKIGKELKADGVIIGRVDIFQERVGSTLGITRPASVGFEVELISVPDDKLLWRSSFYETQESLSENIGSLPLFIKRKGRWITAEELSRYGVGEVIRGYPGNKR